MNWNFAEQFETIRDSLNNKYLYAKYDPTHSFNIAAKRSIHLRNSDRYGCRSSISREIDKE